MSSINPASMKAAPTIGNGGADLPRLLPRRPGDGEARLVPLTELVHLTAESLIPAADALPADSGLGLRYGSSSDLLDSVDISKQAQSASNLRQSAARLWANPALVKGLMRMREKQSALGLATARQKECAERIRVVLLEAGVRFAPNERFEIAMDGEGRIAVKGLKDKLKAGRIEAALARDDDLPAMLRQANLCGKVAQGERLDGNSQSSYSLSSQAQYELMADYLQSEFDLSLDDLSLARDEAADAYAIQGAEGRLAAVLEKDSDLALAIQGVLLEMPEGGYAARDQVIEFEFSNGMIIDPATRAAAQNLATEIQTRLFQGMREYNNMVAEAWRMNCPPSVGPKELSQLIASSLFYLDSIEIIWNLDGWSVSGRIGDIAPTDLETGAKVCPAAREMIDQWLNNIAAGGIIEGLFEQMLVNHQAEYGDAAGHAHLPELRVTQEGALATVQSPEADAAILEQAQAFADAIGQGLARSMRQQGIFEPAFDIRLDENGRLVSMDGLMADDMGGALLKQLLASANMLIDSGRAAGRAAGGGAADADMTHGDARRRRNGFMASPEAAERHEAARHRREADKSEGNRATDSQGNAKAPWHEASGRLGAIDGVDTVTENRRAADGGRISGDGLISGPGHSQWLPGVRRRLDTGLREFSMPDLSLQAEMNAVGQRLKTGTVDARLLADAVSLLGKWLGQLHDPSLARQIAIRSA